MAATATKGSPTKHRADNNARQLLLSLGMGQYNATIAIQYMFLTPAATDPAMPSVILMTKHLQLGLRAAGASKVMVTGQIDDPTARALIQLLGPDWNQVAWYELFRATAEAKKRRTLEHRASEMELGLVPDTADGLGSLPAVPGGMLTWAALAVVGGYLLLRKKH
jgi:hypothetical protein